MNANPQVEFEPMLWIDGAWHASHEYRDDLNPATGELIASVARASAQDVEIAIRGAVTAQRGWANISAVERGLVLKRTALLLLERKDELAKLLTIEQGKTLSQSTNEIEYAASFFQWFGEEARRVYGRIAAHPEADREFTIEHRPAGVAGLITPWNFPLAQGAKKIAASLAAGCSAVWKPAELTPLIALSMGPLMAEAGLPNGLLQIVPGSGETVGKVLAEHPAVRVLSLTGSTKTGSAWMAAGASGIKRMSLELGGNAPFIVLPDADLDFACDQLVKLKMFVAGQVCVTANRIFVPTSLREAFVERLYAQIRNLVVGNGLNEHVDVGPLIQPSACENVRDMVNRAVSRGAKIICQNYSFNDDAILNHDGFFPPTVLADVRDDMAVACDEVFGPVIPILDYESIGEVIERANATPYGLAAYVYGTDLNMCRSVASRLDVGIVGVNEWRPLKAEIPFGGIKQSGIGSEGGEEGIHEYLTTRVISMPKPTNFT